MDTSTIPGEEVGLRLAHAAGFLPSSYMSDSAGDLRDIDELSQVIGKGWVGVMECKEEVSQGWIAISYSAPYYCKIHRT